jgi:hypothetical protein
MWRMCANWLTRAARWVLLAAVWVGTAPEAGGVIIPQPGDSATSRPAQSVEQPSPAHPSIEKGSRGVARNLLLAGIATAAVVAALSGVIALWKKQHPQAGGEK